MLNDDKYFGGTCNFDGRIIDERDSDSGGGHFSGENKSEKILTRIGMTYFNVWV